MNSMIELIVNNTHNNDSKLMCIKNDFDYTGIALSILTSEYERHKKEINFLNCINAREIIINLGYKITDEEEFHSILNRALKHLYSK